VSTLPTKKGFEKELKEWLEGASLVVVAGVGNEIRRDDFVGVKIVQELLGKVTEKVHLIECETVPESFMDEIVEVKPTHVLIVDAAILGLKPGEIRLYDVEKVVNIPSISTHTLPIRVFCDYITELTKTKIALLLIQPENAEFGEGLSSKVALAAKQISKVLLDILP
jgi:hydrogenase 3 maturation protease